MRQLKALLLAAIDEQPQLTEAERGNLLGECTLIESFLVYNDISAMGRMHEHASALMTRPAISINNRGGWTFGSPSVLWMFHRDLGQLAQEQADMNRCMPCYCKITAGHGQGADLVMSGEAAFLQARFTDAQIELERAYAAIKGNGQENIALCCDFLALRLYLMGCGSPRYTPQDRRDLLREQRNVAWVHMWDACCAYFYALLGMEQRIPEAFREHRLDEMNFLAPGRPMMELIENQVYLAQKDWVKVIGRRDKLMEACMAFHYGAVALTVRIQTAAAYAMLEKRDKATALLLDALRDAAPDGLLMPFVENYRYLAPLLNRAARNDFVQQIIKLGDVMETCRTKLNQDTLNPPPILSGLTQREREICTLMAARLSNREIAEKLYLSEGSVKQYSSQIYSKLQIDGDTRTKRKRLIDLLTCDKT